MNNIVIITQARSNSTRLPEKVLLRIGNKTMLQIHLDRLKKVKNADKIIVATTTNEADIKIVREAEMNNVSVYRGSETDVLDRYYNAAILEKAGIIVRVTSDCPFIDPEIIDEMIQLFKEENYDYISNTFEYTYPDGFDVEIFSMHTLEMAHKNGKLKSEREHVTSFIRNNSDYQKGNIFRAFNFANPEKTSTLTRLTLDEAADFEVIKILVERLGTERPWKEYYDYLLQNPDINQLNNHISANEGYSKSIQEDGTY